MYSRPNGHTLYCSVRPNEAVSYRLPISCRNLWSRSGGNTVNGGLSEYAYDSENSDAACWWRDPSQNDTSIVTVSTRFCLLLPYVRLPPQSRGSITHLVFTDNSLAQGSESRTGFNV